MKFPYTLSSDRLSLLSQEDRELYEYEHSPYYSYVDKVECVNAFRKAKDKYMELLESDNEFKSLNDSEKKQMSEAVMKVEASYIIDEVYEFILPTVADVLSEDEIVNLKEILNETVYKLIDEDNQPKPLNEDTPGHDLTFWIPGLGWLGKLAGGLLTAGLAGIVGLIMAGKDKMAAKSLEKYMNKLVETTDNGLHKKKSLFSFFSKDKTKFSGDQSFSCFRAIQEIYERKIAANTLVAGKACGFFGNDAISSATSQTIEGGLNDFKANVIKPVDDFIQKNTSEE